MNGDRAMWVKRLKSAAEATLGKLPRIPHPGEFKDERRNQLAVDEGLFAALRSDTRWGDVAAKSREGDVCLWCGAPVDSVVLPCNTTHSELGRPLLGDWMDQPCDQPSVGMEVWGERELCALHALWSRARTATPEDRARWCRRGFQACRWLLANLQPDNATNYPWSVHVWLIVSEQGVHEWGNANLGPEARVYAETLLHNCQVGPGHGKADRRSAWILWHAARELESW